MSFRIDSLPVISYIDSMPSLPAGAFESSKMSPDVDNTAKDSPKDDKDSKDDDDADDDDDAAGSDADTKDEAAATEVTGSDVKTDDATATTTGTTSLPTTQKCSAEHATKIYLVIVRSILPELQKCLTQKVQLTRSNHAVVNICKRLLTVVLCYSDVIASSSHHLDSYQHLDICSECEF